MELSERKPMNTLILFCDQHNASITGCYGNPKVHTPNIDALALRGCRFENAYTTTPLCVPARASMATGNYPFAGGFWDNAHPFAGKQTSWGARLKEHGNRVSAIGKLHFQDEREETFPGQRIPMNVSQGVGDLMTALRSSEGSTPALRNQIQSAGAGDSDYLHYDRKIAQMAADFLRREAPREKEPWCLYVGFTTPHYPLKVPPELLRLYEPFDQFPVDKEWEHPQMLHPALQKYKETTQLNQKIQKEELQKAIAVYYAMVTFMDQQVGVVLDALMQAGLEDSTRILYSDDHGDSAGEHGLFFKSTMNEGSVRIPLILAGPDLPKNQTVHSCVSIVDYYPTILDWMGIERTPEEKQLPGISLMDVLDGKADPSRCVFSEYHAAGFADSVFMTRKGDYKRIDYMGYDRPQLFCLSEDPLETMDLAGNAEYQDVLRDLGEELRRICNPEELSRKSMEDQKKLIQSMGGPEAIARKGLTPFSAVPEGLGM